MRYLALRAEGVFDCRKVSRVGVEASAQCEIGAVERAEVARETFILHALRKTRDVDYRESPERHKDDDTRGVPAAVALGFAPE